MDIPEKARLEKFLGMLGSSFDGERANAARMISAMAEKKSLTIPELIHRAFAQDQWPGSQPPRDGLRTRATPYTMLEGWLKLPTTRSGINPF
jgi:hypothetical protein